MDESISSIGILGICYTGNVRVVKNSVILEMIEIIEKAGVTVLVNDSLFTEEEIIGSFKFHHFCFDGSMRVESLMLFAGHRQYSMMSVDQIDRLLTGKKIIWDNTAIWEKYRDEFKTRGISYRMIGRKDWRKG